MILPDKKIFSASVIVIRPEEKWCLPGAFFEGSMVMVTHGVIVCRIRYRRRSATASRRISGIFLRVSSFKED
jgi:hypothetical protein